MSPVKSLFVKVAVKPVKPVGCQSADFTRSVAFDHRAACSKNGGHCLALFFLSPQFSGFYFGTNQPSGEEMHGRSPVSAQEQLRNLHKSHCRVQKADKKQLPVEGGIDRAERVDLQQGGKWGVLQALWTGRRVYPAGRVSQFLGGEE